MVVVDTNAFVHAVGRLHPLREPARSLLRDDMPARTLLATSAKILQELMSVYLSVARFETLDASLAIGTCCISRSARDTG